MLHHLLLLQTIQGQTWVKYGLIHKSIAFRKAQYVDDDIPIARWIPFQKVLDQVRNQVSNR